MNAPALSLAFSVAWEKLRDGYAAHLAKLHPVGVGVLFIRRIDNVVEKLGRHYGCPTKYNQKEGVYGDSKAFLHFMAEMRALIPQPATAITL